MEEEKKEEQIVEEKEAVQKKSKKKVYVIAALCLVLVLAAVICLYAAGKWSKVKKTKLDKGSLAVSKQVEQELEGGYLNAALFGVNMKAADDESVDSDAVYIVSVNLDSKEIKLVSVYGNTILGTKSGEKLRVKDAYAKGGAEKAIALLNESLDLDIQKYVSVNFKAMADMIDLLGGVEIEVTEEEVPHIDGYTRDMAAALGEEAVKLAGPGKQKLNGLQAVGYCRIRITEGGDVKRGGRQQAVMKEMLKSLEGAKLSLIDKIMDKIFPQTETNFTFDEAAGYGKDFASYKIQGIQAFPAEVKSQSREGGKDGDYAEAVECEDYEQDVVKLHESLFEGVDYVSSGSVKKIAEILDN